MDLPFQFENDSFTFTITIDLQRKHPIILVDTSYYVFYRYFATYRWYSFQHKSKENPEEYIQNNESEFNEALFKHFDGDIGKLCKKWKTTTDNIIFCKDCPRNDIWRLGLYPQYKQSRTTHKNFNPEAFPVLYQKIDQFKVVSMTSLEADDIAYLTHQTLRECGCTNKIIFITNDNDYIQMKDDNNEIYNLEGKGKNICERSSTTPDKVLLSKIINGDKSDNILPVKMPMSKAFLNQCLEMKEDDLASTIDELNINDKFALNQQLIDFRFIPVDKQREFKERHKFVMT